MQLKKIGQKCRIKWHTEEPILIPVPSLELLPILIPMVWLWIPILILIGRAERWIRAERFLDKNKILIISSQNVICDDDCLAKLQKKMDLLFQKYYFYF